MRIYFLRTSKGKNKSCLEESCTFLLDSLPATVCFITSNNIGE